MVRALVLGTYTIFNYDPSDDEAKQLYARVRKVAVASLEGKDLPVQDSKEMKARLRAAEKKLLKSVTLFDVYQGKGLEEHEKSYAMAFTLQHPDATLNDKQIESAMSRILDALQSAGARLR